MDEDPAPKPAEKAEGMLARVTQSKTKKEPFTHSLDPPRLRHSEPLCAPSMPPC
jgi:hypothetical protein